MLIASESLHQLNQVKDFVRTIIRLQPFEIRKTVCGSPVWDQRLIASSVNGSACCVFIISFQLPHAQAECSSQLQHGLQCRGDIQHQFKLEKKCKRIRNLRLHTGFSVLSSVLCACFVEKYILVTCAPFEGSTDPI